MGHRRLAGLVSEAQIAGCSFVRIDVPKNGAGPAHVATQFYSASAVYCITPTTEDLARQVATASSPAPITEWELPRRTPQLPAYADE